MPKFASISSVARQPENGLGAAVISLIGSDQFFGELADLLGEALPFKWLHIFQYSKDAPPVALGNHPRKVAYKRGFENYLNFTYIINPSYRAFCRGTQSGVYLISEFIQDSYDDIIGSADFEVRIEDRESIGYRTPGWPKNMEEFIVLINLPDETVIDLTLLTELENSHHKENKDRLKGIFPILNAVLLKQFEINPRSFEHYSRPGHEERPQKLDCDALTKREQEVIQLILTGHNSLSIAQKLGVSLSTIKTHRRNIYSKLRISSQAELFSLFSLHPL